MLNVMPPGVRIAVRLSIALALGPGAWGCGPEPPYPGREIRLVVHASPGGISDAVSRHVARGLQERLGVPVVAENRVGAAGSVALSFVARSRPDGYTLGYAPVDMTIIPHLGYSRVTLDDFDYLTLHTRAPGALAVRADSPLATLETFVSMARARRLSMGTSGSGSIWHLAGLALSGALDVPLSYVPFGGSGQAVTALLGGHVDAVVAAPFEVDAHVRAGHVRVLGVMAEARSPLLPDVPTFHSLGYPDLSIDAWGGFLAPRGIPAERRQPLVDALHDVLSSPDFERFARERGLEVQILTGAAFEQFVREESKQFEVLVRRAGLGLRASGTASDGARGSGGQRRPDAGRLKAAPTNVAK
jgi:tripartite-type tricarboxylate transporter receptor subunit TctC